MSITILVNNYSIFPKYNQNLVKLTRIPENLEPKLYHQPITGITAGIRELEKR